MADDGIQFGVYLIERLKDNKATPLLSTSNVSPESQDMGLGKPLREPDLKTIYNYPSAQLPEMASAFNSFKRFVTTGGGYKTLSFSHFISGDDTNYLSTVLRVPEQMWSDILLGTLMVDRGMIHADLFNKKQILFNPKNILGSFVDLKSDQNKIIQTVDNSGYTYSNMLAGWASAIGAGLPRIAGIEQSGLFDLESSGAGNSIFLRLAMPQGKHIYIPKNAPYTEIIRESLNGLSQREGVDITSTLRSELEKISPVLSHLQAQFSRAQYEADPITPLQDPLSQFYALVGEARGGAQLSHYTSSKQEELPEELPEPTFFKNPIIRSLAINLGARLMGRKELKVNASSNASYGAVHAAYLMQNVVRALEEDRTPDLDTLDITVEGQLDMAEKTLPDWARAELSKYRVSLTYNTTAIDLLVAGVAMAQSLRKNIVSCGSDKRVLSRLVDEIHTPNARIASLSNDWYQMEDALAKGNEPVAQQLKDHMLQTIRGGERDLKDYEHLFYQKVYSKKGQMAVTDVKRVDDVLSEGTSGSQLLERMREVESDFVLIGSDWANKKYVTRSIQYLVLPRSSDIADVFEPLGTFASDVITKTGMAALTESRIPTKPIHMAYGSIITNLINQGIRIKAGVSSTPRIPRASPSPENITYWYTESLPISHLGRSQPIPTLGAVPNNMVTEAYVLGAMRNFCEVNNSRVPTLGGKAYTINEINGKPDIRQLTAPGGKSVLVELGILELPGKEVVRTGLYATYI